MSPLPPLAAGTVNSAMAVPAVKVLAETEPMPKDGAESVPRMMTVADEGVPMVKFWVFPPLATTEVMVQVIVSSFSATPSL